MNKFAVTDKQEVNSFCNNCMANAIAIIKYSGHIGLIRY